MEWSQILSVLQGQGPVFWIAAAAVAAGAALLAAAVFLQWRRAAARRGAAGPRVTVTETGYTAVAAPAPAAPPAPAADPRLAELGERLAAAAARLEELRARRVRPDTSTLKSTPGRVEYVHRSGRA